MASDTLRPWAKARKENQELDSLLTRRNILASAERSLTAQEIQEILQINKSIEVWKTRLNLE